VNLPYFSLYPKDFDTDAKVRAMEDRELGLYIRCLNYSWVNDGLPADPEEVRRAFRDTPGAFAEKWPRVEACFPVAADGRRRNPRQEKERAQAIEKSLKASANAKRAHSGRSASAEQMQSGRSARASESVSDSGSESFSGESAERGNGAAAAAPDGGAHRDESRTELVPSDEFFEPVLFEGMLGLFIALGRGMGISDRIRCENAWKGLTQAERRRAHDYAMSRRTEWQTRPTGKIAQPWNYLAEKHWERDAPRLLAQTRGPSKAEAAHDEARRRFLGGQA